VSVGIVVIGRNEGERLKECLRSLRGGDAVVYVDSGSSDGSVEWARSHGALVVELPSPPAFTAARGRNAGLEALKSSQPLIRMVQMVDGDCAVAPTWIEAGRRALENDRGLAVVFGRRRERFPEASIYNALCDDEWNTPVGPAKSCGGDALFRIEALEQAGGYDPSLIAGEEPDLCLRLRAAGWCVERIDEEMTTHDAAILHFGQWWRRAKRGGHAFVELAHRHRRAGDPAWRQKCLSVLVWAGLLPLVLLAATAFALRSPTMPALGLVLLCLLPWPLQILRLFLREWVRGNSPRKAAASAALMTIGKFAEMSGMLLYASRQLSRRTATLIEYKRR
jgi:GT2 family glycosyltransferase